MTKRIGWIVLAISVLLQIVAITLSQLRGESFLQNSEAIGGLAFISFAVVGALILHRHPGHKLGYVFAATGLLSVVASATDEYARYAAVKNPDLPGILAAAWVQNWIWFAPVVLAFTFGVALFPDGNLASKRWRWVTWTAGIGLAGFSAVVALTEGSLDGFPGLENPTGVIPESSLSFAFFLLVVIGAIGSIASLFFRYRKTGVTERLQIKYVVFGVAVALITVLFFPLIPIDISNVTEDILFGLTMCIFPVACGVSILRYRLYDIDLIINRAVVYGLLTAILAISYLAIVFSMQQILPIAGDSDIAVAASTLAVAALFGPARARVQTFIDRRFFRSKYDAVATLDELSARLRSEVAIEDVQRDILSTVSATVKPAHTSLWLRTSS